MKVQIVQFDVKFFKVLVKSAVVVVMPEAQMLKHISS